MNKLSAVVGAVLALAVLGPVSAFADTWGDQINDPTRFVLLPGYGDGAVLDQETGLVWERSPDITTFWKDAVDWCANKSVNGRKGWRLPAVEELASLIDTTQANLALPAAHPFNLSTLAVRYFWAATGHPPDSAWAVRMTDGNVSFGLKNTVNSVWCVRGGQGVDAPR